MRLLERLRRLSPRGEKTVRLVAASVIGGGFGIAAVVLDSEALGYAAAGVVLAGILIGPLTARALHPRENDR